MIIGVFSDTHGDIRKLGKCLKLIGQPELLIHAGDLYDDGLRMSHESGIPCVGVVGNCDYIVKGPKEELIEIESKRIYITHGHNMRVKYTHDVIIQRAVELGAHLVIFGHTHFSEIFQEKGITFLNPGSLHSPRGGSKRSCGRVKVSKNRIEANILNL